MVANLTQPDDADHESVRNAVGAQVRYLRTQLGVSSRKLAGLSGMSVSALSKIENGRISPSLHALSSLAKALNVPIATLFSELDKSRDCYFVPAGQGMRMERRGTREGHQYDLLGSYHDGLLSFEPFLITLEEGAGLYTSFRHDGVEFIYMLEGAMIYRHGSKDYDLNMGDSLTFDSASSHGPAMLIQTPCRYISVIVSLRQR
ncbi:helix-turn-helix transcriptional regulator [Erythrobacteraceae bacterium E2-1 Yellow Sea]|nr:helix-turn-helix transcriptional regulator [Erythrobacteraceae bacterium E2-1 Yellow Sea]